MRTGTLKSPAPLLPFARPPGRTRSSPHAFDLPCSAKTHSLILAAIYPVLVWFLAYRYRRTPIGIAIPIMAGLLAGTLAPMLRVWAGRSAEALVPLVYAESVLVLAVGVWLSLMPRRKPSGHYCPHCHYDLAGLDTTTPGAVCPECGGDVTPASLNSCSTCQAPTEGRDLTRTGQRCSRCGTILPLIRAASVANRADATSK